MAPLLTADGAPVEIGRVIKMSKSKKNVVDPDEIVAHYGADAVRWFMLSDSPPERDLPWSKPGSKAAGASSSACGGCSASTMRRAAGEDKALDRKTHQTIAAVARGYRGAGASTRRWRGSTN